MRLVIAPSVPAATRTRRHYAPVSSYELLRRAEGARRAIRNLAADPELALAMVVWPPPELETRNDLDWRGDF